jgi:hypothetical protein
VAGVSTFFTESGTPGKVECKSDGHHRYTSSLRWEHRELRDLLKSAGLSPFSRHWGRSDRTWAGLSLCPPRRAVIAAHSSLKGDDRDRVSVSIHVTSKLKNPTEATPTVPRTFQDSVSYSHQILEGLPGRPGPGVPWGRDG